MQFGFRQGMNSRRRMEQMRAVLSSGGGGGGSSLEDLATQLLADLTTAAGTAPTALWVPGVGMTFVATGQGNRITLMNDLTGNGYNLAEGASGKGAVLCPAGSWSSNINNGAGYDENDGAVLVDDASGLAAILAEATALGGSGSAYLPIINENTGEIMVVTGISGNSLSVTRQAGGGTDATVTDNDTLSYYVIGDKPCLFFRRGNFEWLQSALAHNSATPNMFQVTGATWAGLVKTPDNGVSSATLASNPELIGENSISSFIMAYLRDATIDRIKFSGNNVVLTSTQWPYDEDHVLSGRLNNIDDTVDFNGISVDKTHVKNTGTNSMALTGKLSLGKSSSNIYASMLVGALCTFNVDGGLSDAQLNDVVDLLRAFNGLSPVADP